MRFLKNNPQKDTAADIVELRMLSKAAVSKGADALIQKGMLEREADPTDRRKIHLKLTKEAFPVTREIQKPRKPFWVFCMRDFRRKSMKCIFG